ncbi:MAG: hypothetical protein E3J94_07160 [Desulfobacteraceae bacterium]|nr:MAG: hypothetical protein E3J94_07160 [Desulfobacteraceae bacterium]
MARNRMIQKIFWDDEKLSGISKPARLVFIALWNLSDDYGVVKGNPSWLKSRIFPYEKNSMDEFNGLLREIEDKEFIFSFKSNKEKYFFIKNFQKYQIINRPSKQRNPEPPDNLVSTHGALIDERELERESKLERELEVKGNIYTRVVQYLNQKTGKKFSDKTKTTRSFINARVNDGFSEQDFLTVIDNKCSKWLSDPKMIEFLRPQTLFGTKFESYLQDIPHPLQGVVSSKTMKSIENIKKARRRSEDEE